MTQKSTDLMTHAFSLQKFFYFVFTDFIDELFPNSLFPSSYTVYEHTLK